jgi:predicted ferric reductase
MSDKLAWYVSRSSGWVAFVLLACTVIWGVLGISKLIERRGLPRWLLDLHRHLASLTVVFTAVHLVALVADNYMRIAWKEILVPFALDYRPGAVAWGVVAMYLLIAIQVSSWLRARMPRRWWRRIHFLSYPTLWMVTMHGLRAGTDAGRPLVRWGVIVIISAVAFVTFWRVFTVGPRRRRSDQVDTLTPDGTDLEAAQDSHATGAPADRQHVGTHGLRTR